MASETVVRFPTLGCVLFVFVVLFMEIVRGQDEEGQFALPSSYSYRVPLYQNFLTEFKIVDTALDYDALREKVLSGINELQLSLESVKENLQLYNITVHDMS
jgi:hypothetical protein